MKKRGVSPIIATILLVGLAVVLVGVVWAIVNNLVQDQTQQASACFGIFEKVTLNEDYTCYNKGENIFQISIDIKDIDVKSIIVSVEGKEVTKTFELSNTPLDQEGVYRGDASQVILPPKNGGKTYIIDSAFGIELPPKAIRISPNIKGYQCEVSSSVTQIGEC